MADRTISADLVTTRGVRHLTCSIAESINDLSMAILDVPPRELRTARWRMAADDYHNLACEVDRYSMEHGLPLYTSPELMETPRFRGLPIEVTL